MQNLKMGCQKAGYRRQLINCCTSIYKYATGNTFEISMVSVVYLLVDRQDNVYLYRTIKTDQKCRIVRK